MMLLYFKAIWESQVKNLRGRDKMKILPFILLFFLAAGCKPDIKVNDIRLDWDNNKKKVTAKVSNNSFIGTGHFSVSFKGIELPQSDSGTAEIIKEVESLGAFSSVWLDVDFRPVESAENDHLWNVNEIIVYADHRDEIGEEHENNNLKSKDVPFNSRLPIIIIDTAGQQIVDEPKIPAQMKIINRCAAACHIQRNFIYDTTFDYNGKIGIEIRGQSSQSFDKKQYGFETLDSSGNELSVSLLGMPEESDWILQGPYSDKTLMRNVIAYDLSNKMGRYASKTKFVEVFLNDTSAALSKNNYIGVYVLMEKIKRDRNRINVTKLLNTDNSEPQISGGYILKIDKINGVDSYFTTSLGTRIIHVYPDGGSITTEQKVWITNYMNDFETALNGPDFADPVVGYAKYIDVDSFVDYYLLNELLKNVDSLRISTYMHKNRSGKLTMGPVWDFDLSTGNAGHITGGSDSIGWYLTIAPTVGDLRVPFWWGRLLEDNAFRQKLANRWTELKYTVFDITKVETTIDSTASLLKEAQARNFNRWPILGTSVWPDRGTPNPGETYETLTENLKTWLQDRSTWIDSNINYPILP